MAAFKMSPEEWEILKLKFTRKYNHLTEEDLQFQAGQEDELIGRLAQRVRRNRDYIRYTLSKGLVDLESNRL
ncbi:hypothetical protein [Parapedobacter lycopersici]|uniref:hypothetical protein n=1 Tax=Parapedobacter lycopersici TaxID=1864939 RepID=UPI00214D842A|nr:hypothetical protein [Parapedobacter lycopersici]